VIKDLIHLPSLPRRMLDDIGELVELGRELLGLGHELMSTSRSLDAKMDKLDRVLDDLRRFQEKLDRLDARTAQIEREVMVTRGGVQEIAETVPTLAKGPLEKAKEALTGE
jgi:hypothetical protein